MAGRGATTAGAGIALNQHREDSQKRANSSGFLAIFLGEPRRVGFRTLFSSAVGVTNHKGGQIFPREQTVGRIAPLKRRTVDPKRETPDSSAWKLAARKQDLAMNGGVTFCDSFWGTHGINFDTLQKGEEAGCRLSR